STASACSGSRNPTGSPPTACSSTPPAPSTPPSCAPPPAATSSSPGTDGAVFTAETLAIGALAALLVGVSKTGMPGAGLVSIPLFASIVDGRLIPGTTLPVLIVADLFAVAWYRQHARWDVMRPLAPWIGLGYAAGSAFFIAV